MAGTLVLRRPGTLVLIEPGGPELARQMAALVREHGGGGMSPLQAGTLVRKVAALAPLRCGCGCGRRMSADELAGIFERGAVLS